MTGSSGSPLSLEEAARAHRHPVGTRWSVDETYIKVAGVWCYAYRALDEHDQVIDVYVSTIQRNHRDGVGAEVRLTASGLRAQLRQVQAGTSLGSGNAREVYFGLGHAAEAETLEVRWPSGAVQILRHVAANRRITIVEPGRSRWPGR